MHYVAATFAGLTLILSIYIVSLLQNISGLKLQIEINQNAIQSQNEALEALRVDSEKYKCDLDSINDYTRNKYNSVIVNVENETCEVKLKELEKALNIYEYKGAEFINDVKIK